MSLSSDMRCPFWVAAARLGVDPPWLSFDLVRGNSGRSICRCCSVDFLRDVDRFGIVAKGLEPRPSGSPKIVERPGVLPRGSKRSNSDSKLVFCVLLLFGDGLPDPGGPRLTPDSPRLRGLDVDANDPKFPLRRFSIRCEGICFDSVFSDDTSIDAAKQKGSSWVGFRCGESSTFNLGSIVSAGHMRLGPEFPLSRDSVKTRFEGLGADLVREDCKAPLRRMVGRWILALGGKGMATGEAVELCGTRKMFPCG